MKMFRKVIFSFFATCMAMGPGLMAMDAPPVVVNILNRTGYPLQITIDGIVRENLAKNLSATYEIKYEIQLSEIKDSISVKTVGGWFNSYPLAITRQELFKSLEQDPKAIGLNLAIENAVSNTTGLYLKSTTSILRNDQPAAVKSPPPAAQPATKPAAQQAPVGGTDPFFKQFFPGPAETAAAQAKLAKQREEELLKQQEEQNRKERREAQEEDDRLEREAQHAAQQAVPQMPTPPAAQPAAQPAAAELSSAKKAELAREQKRTEQLKAQLAEEEEEQQPAASQASWWEIGTKALELAAVVALEKKAAQGDETAQEKLNSMPEYKRMLRVRAAREQERAAEIQAAEEKEAARGVNLAAREIGATCKSLRPEGFNPYTQIRLCIKNLTGHSIHIAIVGSSHPKNQQSAGWIEAFMNLGSRLLEWEYFLLGNSIELQPNETISIALDQKTSADIKYRYLYWNTQAMTEGTRQSSVPGSSIMLRHIPSYTDYLDLGTNITKNRRVKIFTETQVTTKAKEIIEANHPYKNQEAQVQSKAIANMTLVTDEEHALQARKQKTESAIRAIVSPQHTKLPSIGLCFSGGGLRALYASLGFSMGLQNNGLLDTVSYAAGLSGSTWFLMKWLKDGNQFDKIREELRTSLVKGLLAKEILKPEGKDMNDADPYRAAVQLLQGTMYYPDVAFRAQLMATLLCDTGANPPCTRLGTYRPVELWADGLAKRIFAKDKDKYTFKLSSLKNKALAGSMPITLFSSIRTDKDDDAENQLFADAELERKEKGTVTDATFQRLRGYQWFEATPFSASFIQDKGPETLVTRIPIWALGRKFVDGKSVEEDKFFSPIQVAGMHYHPEPSAIQLIAAFGAAFSVTFLEGAKAAGAQGSEVLSAVQGFIKGLGAKVGVALTDEQIAEFLKVTNLAKGLYIYDFTQGGDAQVELRDGGIFYNLPLPLLFNPHRNLDIIIANDSSGDLHENLGNELDKFRKYQTEPKYINTKLSNDFLNERKFKEKIKNDIKDANADEIKFAVFNDPREDSYEEGKMTIIYVPTVSTMRSLSYKWKSPTEQYSTFKLQYSETESNQFVDYSENLADGVAEYIKEIIKAKTEKMNAKK